ncbi:hypothetical protein Tco_0716992 [Tanacetum coccineum]
MIVPLHVRYPPVAEARAPENLTGEARKPGDRHGDPDSKGSALTPVSGILLQISRNVRLGLAAMGFNPSASLALKFNMRAMVLWTINDFPARSSLSGWSGQGYRACPTCNKDTPSVHKTHFCSCRAELDINDLFYELEYWSFLTLKHNLDVMHIEKNVLESILNTLLMNDKSKDTAKARQDLKSLGIRSGLWLGQNKNGKCSKPQAAYSFKPEDRKKFCQFIKGVKLPDGLLPYGPSAILPPDVAKPLIELCLFFKQICSQTLMVDDMLKAQSKVIDILCNLELIYPPAFFDIMIHLVIHLPLEAIFGGPIRPRWMYPFERYMKKLKNYVRNKAKPEGSIAEGYVAEEALTFSSHYFWDVTTKFNRPDRNVDCPPQYPEIDTYRAKFKSEFPDNDMKEAFPGWFGKQIRQRHVDNDPGVRRKAAVLIALALWDHHKLQSQSKTLA